MMGCDADVAVAIVLARQGSRGVPGKNTAPVGGRPCMAWTLEAAQSARSVRWVVVSTDDPMAASIALDQGVPVIDRPGHLATDRAPIDEAVRHAHADLSSRTGSPDLPDAPIVILYANVPIRPPALIDRAVHLLVEAGCDSVQSYASVGKHHPWWTVRIGADGRLAPWEGEALFHDTWRRQDLPPAFVPDGGVTVVTAEALFGQIDGVPPGPHAFLGRDRRAVMTEPGEVVDIDAPVDLALADVLLRQRGVRAEV